jgi:hypothetical protein
MGLFTKRRVQKLEALAGDYALSQGAGAGIADCFAEYVVTEGADPVAEWPAWCARRLRECPQCGEPWAIFVPCADSWECWDCQFFWDAEAV